MTRTCQLQRLLAKHPPPEEEAIKKPQGTRTIILEPEIYDVLLKHYQKKMLVFGCSEMFHILKVVRS